jgi:hypothetical protein
VADGWGWLAWMLAGAERDNYCNTKFSLSAENVCFEFRKPTAQFFLIGTMQD